MIEPAPGPMPNTSTPAGLMTPAPRSIVWPPGADLAKRLGLRVNAGHGLTVANLPALLDRVPHLEELNMGHSLVAGAVFTGIESSVKAFLEAMRSYRLGPRS